MSEYIMGLLTEVCTLLSAIWVFSKRQFVEYGQNISLKHSSTDVTKMNVLSNEVACWRVSVKHTSNAIQTQHKHNNSHETVLPCLSTSPWIGCHKSLNHSVRYENILAAYAILPLCWFSHPRLLCLVFPKVTILVRATLITSILDFLSSD